MKWKSNIAQRKLFKKYTDNTDRLQDREIFKREQLQMTNIRNKTGDILRNFVDIKKKKRVL